MKRINDTLNNLTAALFFSVTVVAVTAMNHPNAATINALAGADDTTPPATPTVDTLTTLDLTPTLTGTFDAADSPTLEVLVGTGTSTPLFSDDFSSDSSASYTLEIPSVHPMSTSISGGVLQVGYGNGIYYVNGADYQDRYTVQARLRPTGNAYMALAVGIDANQPRRQVFDCGSSNHPTRRNTVLRQLTDISSYSVNYLRGTHGLHNVNMATDLATATAHHAGQDDVDDPELWYQVSITVDNATRTLRCEWYDEKHAVQLVDTGEVAFPAGVQTIRGSVGVISSWQTFEVDELEVRQNPYTLGDGYLSHEGGNWRLNIPEHHALMVGTYEVTATATDIAGNPANDVSQNELTITAQRAPTVDPLTTSNPTPTLTGTYDAANSTALGINIVGPAIFIDDFSGDTSGDYTAYGNSTWDIDTVNQRLTTTNNDRGFYYLNAANYNRNYEITARLQPVDNDLIGLAFGIETGTPNSRVYACGSARQGGFASTGAGIYRYEQVTDYLRQTGGTTTTLVQDRLHNYTSADWYAVTVIVDNTARTIDCRWDNERTGETEVNFTGIPFPAGVTEIAGSVGILSSWQASVHVDTLQGRAKALDYTLGDGHLSNNGDDWSLSIPTDEALLEGVHDITATATDAFANRVSDGSGNELTVTSLTTPIITSSPVTTAVMGVAYSYDVEAIDPDVSDTLTFSLTTAPTGMSIDADTGLITWVPTATGEYEVTVSVTDNVTAPVTQTFTITVPNRDPVIISTPVMVASIGEAYQYQVRALELDGDTLEYSLITAPFGMTITSDTGLIEWLPDTTGQVIVEIKVDDGQFSTDTQQYTLTVIDPNINYAPEITSEPVIEGIEGILYEYQVEATDLNNDTLTYLLTTSPTGMNIDSESGLISWASPVAGTYAIEVMVEDPSTASDTQTYTLTILTLPEADTMFQLIWDEMNSVLVNSDVQSALGNLTLSAQEKYEPVFNNLLPNMEEIVDSYSDLERVYISPTLAQYVLSREINGEDRIFFILFVNTENGWLISSM